MNRHARLLAAALLASVAGCAPEAPEPEEDDEAPEPAVVAPSLSCPAAGDSAVDVGWEAYLDDELAQARDRFSTALVACPEHRGARIGMGYVALQEGSPAAAGEIFRGILAEDSLSVEGHRGLGTVAFLQGDLQTARMHLERALRLQPDHQEARRMLRRVTEAQAAEGIPR